MIPVPLEDNIKETHKTSYIPVSGGAIFNTAIALGRLGVQTSYCGGISTDLFGEQICQSLDNSNVDYSFSQRHDAPTTLSFVKFTDGQASYAFYDENTAGRLFGTPNTPTLTTDVKALHCGAISLIQEPCGTNYEKLIYENREKCVLSFDPNIRTSFIQDEAQYRSRLQRLLAISDIIKISNEDLKWISPETSIDEFASSMFDRGCSILLYTEGKKGASLFTPNNKIHVASEDVKIADTIGAGDSFNAGFLSSLSEQNILDKRAIREMNHEQLLTALNKANKVAAFTVTQSGATPPWVHEL